MSSEKTVKQVVAEQFTKKCSGIFFRPAQTRVVQVDKENPSARPDPRVSAGNRVHFQH
jgi:hypothetical protein